MNKVKQFILLILLMCMISINAFAETDTLTYKAKIENGEVTMI